MPELPEVRVVSTRLNKEIASKTITNVIVNLPKLIKNESKAMFIKKLTGKKILKVSNHGKFIVFYLEDDLILLSHLRMEGKYRVSELNDIQKHDYVIFELDNKKLIYSDTRQFGTFHIKHKSDYLLTQPLNKMGEEPQNTDAETLYKRFAKKSIAIKTALLDQTLLVGLGNIYVNEVLWWEKIDPKRKTNEITLKQLKSILKKSAEVMDHSTSLGGTTIHSFKSFNEQTGSYQDELKVHGRENKKCFRCKKMIKKTKVNGRGTYYCEKCQK